MPKKMTVTEYRKSHPDCAYCYNRIRPFERCLATNKIMSTQTAKKCPCYVPEKWKYNEGSEVNENS